MDESLAIVRRHRDAGTLYDEHRKIAETVLRDLAVEELPGGPLRWRSRARFAVDRSGAAGLRRYRSHDVIVLTSSIETVIGPTPPGTGVI